MAALFSRPQALLGAEGNTMVYGWIVDPSTGRRIDEVMVAVYRAPKSFTGEDMVEMFCHGGIAVVRSIHALLLAHGFRQAERGEFTFRAYINGKSDLTKAEAVKEIIESKTDVSRGRAAGRLSGNLFSEIASIKKLIVDTLAAIEVEIEYPEDEETISDAFDEHKLVCAKERLAQLAASWKSERLYQEGARVVLCGRTNAGKSSLFNALLKEERALVSDVEGTTRDWLESWVDFAGVPVRLFDTAGLRDTDDAIEAAGVERTKDLSTEADVIVYVVDAQVGLHDDDRAFLAEPRAIPVVLAWNKCDSGTAPDVMQNSVADSQAGLHVSARTGAGIDMLVETCRSLLCGASSTEREQAGIGSARQKSCVSEALERVSHALEAAASYTLDAVVQDLEDALDALGEVTGEVTPDDVLDSVFAHFCVGK